MEADEFARTMLSSTCTYNARVKPWDVVIIGGGIIGLSTAISLRKQALRVLLVERGEPGREASHAAAGMLAPSGTEMPAVLMPLARASFGLYPEFVHELEDESGVKVDLRNEGTILISEDGGFPDSAEPLSSDRLNSIEPWLRAEGLSAAHVAERSVDPRALVAAALKASRHRGVDISSGSEVKAVRIVDDRVAAVETEKTSYSAGAVVNCAGAWAGCFGPYRFPTRPVKGQMLAVVGGAKLVHVVRAGNVYLVPRSDGRIIIGSTLENVGYNKRVDVNRVQQLFQAALKLLPALSKSRKHEDWAGLRPGTPDNLPILGETSIRGYFAACGHYRDGILLAPITAQIMTDIVLGKKPALEISPFTPDRFNS